MLKTVKLKFTDATKECIMYIDGGKVETYTYDEGQVVLSAIKQLDAAGILAISVEYSRR